MINQVKGAFRNGGELDSQWIADKIANSMSQARYHDKMKIRAPLRDLMCIGTWRGRFTCQKTSGMPSTSLRCN